MNNQLKLKYFNDQYVSTKIKLNFNIKLSRMQNRLSNK